MNLTILSGALVYLILLMFKNQNTYRQREKIMDAIYAYNLRCCKEKRFNEVVSFDCMRSYASSLFDIFDWGNKRIVLQYQHFLVLWQRLSFPRM